VGSARQYLNVYHKQSGKKVLGLTTTASHEWAEAYWVGSGAKVMIVMIWNETDASVITFKDPDAPREQSSQVKLSGVQSELTNLNHAGYARALRLRFPIAGVKPGRYLLVGQLWDEENHQRPLRAEGTLETGAGAIEVDVPVSSDS